MVFGAEVLGDGLCDEQVAHHLSLDGPYEPAADFFQYNLGDGGAGLGGPFDGLHLVVLGHGAAEADEAVLGGPVVARGKGLDEGLKVLVEGAHLRGEVDGAVRLRARPVERLYADGVAGCDKAPVLVGYQEGVHTEQLREGFGAALGDEAQGHLVVRAGGHRPVLEGLQYLLMVIHLAVADEVETLIRRPERLLAPLDVHDGEPPVAQGVAGDLDEAFVVAAAMGYAPHHAPHVFGFYAAVSTNYPAHVSLRALISGRGKYY